MPGLSANTIVDPQLGFTLTLPDEFLPRPDLIGVKPDLVHAFQFGRITEGDTPVLLLIFRMRGIIDRDRLTMQSMPEDFKGSLFVVTWRGIEVDGILTPETVNGIHVNNNIVQIPLRREAIQVNLVGRADREESLQVLLRRVLDGLDGESNWLPSLLPPSIAGSQNYGIVLICVAIVGMIVGLAIFWFASRRFSMATVSVIAFALWLIGWQLHNNRMREVKLASSVLQMLGIAGGLLAWFLFMMRMRKQKQVQKGALDFLANK